MNFAAIEMEHALHEYVVKGFFSEARQDLKFTSDDKELSLYWNFRYFI